MLPLTLQSGLGQAKSQSMHLQDEGNGAFVQRVQQAIADELNVQIIDLTMPQKAKLVAAAQSTM